MSKKNSISEKRICFYYDNGFCKYYKSCNFFHPKDNCSDEECLRKLCEKRHPKECRYYLSQNGCKFKDKCFFKHSKSHLECDICENFKVIIKKDEVLSKEIRKTIKEKDTIIENLNAQIETLKNLNNNLEKAKELLNNEDKVKDVEILKLTADNESLRKTYINLKKTTENKKEMEMTEYKKIL